MGQEVRQRSREGGKRRGETERDKEEGEQRNREREGRRKRGEKEEKGEEERAWEF